MDQQRKNKKIICNSFFNRPKEYKGGELEFDLRDEDPDKKPTLELY